jgi:hypothetical protein
MPFSCSIIANLWNWFVHLLSILRYNGVMSRHIFLFTVLCILVSRYNDKHALILANFIWLKPFLRGHLSYKATFSLSQRWPLNTGMTVVSWNPRASYEMWFHNWYRRNKCKLSYQKHVSLSQYWCLVWLHLVWAFAMLFYFMFMFCSSYSQSGLFFFHWLITGFVTRVTN